MTVPPLDLKNVRVEPNVTPEERTPKQENGSARNKRIEEIKEIDFRVLKDAVNERRNRNHTV